MGYDFIGLLVLCTTVAQLIVSIVGAVRTKERVTVIVIWCLPAKRRKRRRKPPKRKR